MSSQQNSSVSSSVNKQKLLNFQFFKFIIFCGQVSSLLLYLGVFYTQSWLATISLRGSFATFFPTFKIFWYSVAFLDFSVQIYFQQLSFLVGFFGVLLSVGQHIRAVAKFISSNAKYYVKA